MKSTVKMDTHTVLSEEASCTGASSMMITLSSSVDHYYDVSHEMSHVRMNSFVWEHFTVDA